MRLVIGGAYQGKTAYVMTHFDIQKNQILDVGGMINQDGQPDCMEQVCKQLQDGKSQICCVSSFHLLVKFAVQHDMDIFPFLDRMLQAHPDIIIIMDEIGNGIIPLEKEERLYREAVGRAGCRLAEQAGQVVRVVCGIGTVIKS